MVLPASEGGDDDHVVAYVALFVDCRPSLRLDYGRWTRYCRRRYQRFPRLRDPRRKSHPARTPKRSDRRWLGASCLAWARPDHTQLKSPPECVPILPTLCSPPPPFCFRAPVLFAFLVCTAQHMRARTLTPHAIFADFVFLQNPLTPQPTSRRGKNTLITDMAFDHDYFSALGQSNSRLSTKRSGGRSEVVVVGIKEHGYGILP